MTIPTKGRYNEQGAQGEAKTVPFPFSLPVGVNSVQDCFKLRVRLSFLYHWQVIAQGTKTGFEFLMVQPARLVLVKVSVVQSPELSIWSLPPIRPGPRYVGHTHLNIMLNSLRASSVTPVVFLEEEQK